MPRAAAAPVERGFGAIAATGEPDATIEHFGPGLGPDRVGAGQRQPRRPRHRLRPASCRRRAAADQPAGRRAGRRAEGRVVYCAPFELFTGVPCYRCGSPSTCVQPALLRTRWRADPRRWLSGQPRRRRGRAGLPRLGLALVRGGPDPGPRVGEQERIPRILESLAILAARRRRRRAGAGLAGAASALREAVGIPPPGPSTPCVDGALGAVRWSLSDAAYAQALAAGRALTDSLEQAVQLALDEE